MTSASYTLFYSLCDTPDYCYCTSIVFNKHRILLYDKSLLVFILRYLFAYSLPSSPSLITVFTKRVNNAWSERESNYYISFTLLIASTLWIHSSLLLLLLLPSLCSTQLSSTFTPYNVVFYSKLFWPFWLCFGVICALHTICYKSILANSLIEITCGITLRL